MLVIVYSSSGRWAIGARVDLEVALSLEAGCAGGMEPDVWLIHCRAAVTWEANGEVIGLGLICEIAELPWVGSRAGVLQAGVDVELCVERVVSLSPEVGEQSVGIASVIVGVTLVNSWAACHGWVGVPHHRAGREHCVELICAQIDGRVRGRGGSLHHGPLVHVKGVPMAITVRVEHTFEHLLPGGRVAVVLGLRVLDPWSTVAEDAEADGNRRRLLACLAVWTLVAVRVLTVEFRLWRRPQVGVLLIDESRRARDERHDRDAAAWPWVDCRDNSPWQSLACRWVLWDHVVFNPQVIDALEHLISLALGDLRRDFIGGLVARASVPLPGARQQALDRRQ